MFQIFQMTTCMYLPWCKITCKIKKNACFSRDFVFLNQRTLYFYSILSFLFLPRKTHSCFIKKSILKCCFPWQPWLFYDFLFGLWSAWLGVCPLNNVIRKKINEFCLLSWVSVRSMRNPGMPPLKSSTDYMCYLTDN